MKNILEEVAEATSLREGAAGVRRVIECAAAGRGAGAIEGVPLKELARAAGLPLPVASAVRRELEKLGLFDRGGGVRLTEPAADLAVALAIGSAVVDRPLLPSLMAVGEVGLSGDIRPAVGIGRRLAEAARLGVTHAIVPRGTVGAVSVPTALNIAEAADLRAALRAALSAEGAGG